MTERRGRWRERGGRSRTDGEGDEIEEGRREGRGRKGERMDGRREGVESKTRERGEGHHPPWPVFSSPPVASVSDSEAVLPPVVCMMSSGDSCRLRPEQTPTTQLGRQVVTL